MVQSLRPWTGINLKVVERAGESLQDSLHKSNPWDSEDCERVNCLTCESALKDDKIIAKDCHKRSVIYETWCETCIKLEKEKLKCSGQIVSEKVDENDEKMLSV